jgi:hypothetical protein
MGIGSSAVGAGQHRATRFRPGPAIHIHFYYFGLLRYAYLPSNLEMERL